MIDFFQMSGTCPVVIESLSNSTSSVSVTSDRVQFALINSLIASKLAFSYEWNSVALSISVSFSHTNTSISIALCQMSGSNNGLDDSTPIRRTCWWTTNPEHCLLDAVNCIFDGIRNHTLIGTRQWHLQMSHSLADISHRLLISTWHQAGWNLHIHPENDFRELQKLVRLMHWPNIQRKYIHPACVQFDFDTYAFQFVAAWSDLWLVKLFRSPRYTVTTRVTFAKVLNLFYVTCEPSF